MAKKKKTGKPTLLCGRPKKTDGKPCKWGKPCPYHDQGKGKRQAKANKDVTRFQKLALLRLEGKSVKDAAIGAGFSAKTAEGKIYQMIRDSPEYQAAIEAIKKSAHLDTDEIIGTLVEQMRFDLADLFPEDELMQRAKDLGISRQIKKIKRIPTLAGYDEEQKPVFAYTLEIEAYSAQESAKHLTKVFGLEQLPAPNKKAQREFEASVERLMQKARDAGNKLSEEKLRARIVEKLKPRYQGVVSDANN